MTQKQVRVRFAPAPTGMMHLGNVRTALINYIFAQQKKGTFIVRIEDTDQQRNFDPQATHLIEDLHWLGLTFNEGPGVGGNYGPYFQSERTDIYKKKLNILIEKNLVYRCFCSSQELEKKRERQKALKMPPRYDQTCLHLSAPDITTLLERKASYIWRFMLDHKARISIKDLAHGIVIFELKNFSDFPLTREDGSFTFLFANFVDDLVMEISHIFRGEDHLTNTACQGALYQAFNTELPIFLHLPILCNAEGKKLSKRDFGFSLRDLQKAGFLPEAIVNYLAIIGGSYKQEIMSLQDLITTLNFEGPQSTGQIRYDVEKLRWLNHKWINLTHSDHLAVLCRPFLEQHYSTKISALDNEQLSKLLHMVKTELVTLADSIEQLRFYFEPPILTKHTIHEVIAEKDIALLIPLIQQSLNSIEDPLLFIKDIKQKCKDHTISLQKMFCLIRLALTGLIHGPSINDLLVILGSSHAQQRIDQMISLLNN